MHIVMIGPRKLHPHPKAGLDYYVKELALHFVRWGHAATLYSHHRVPEGFQKKTGGLRFKSVRTLSRHHLDTLVYSFVASLRAIFEKAEVIHYHGGAALFAWIPRLFGKKIVVTVHSREWLSQNKPPWLRFFYFAGERLGFLAAHRLGTVSKTDQEDLQKRYGKKVFCLPPGMDLPPPPDTSFLDEKGLQSKRYLLFLGRVEKDKGIEWILKAFDSLPPEKKETLVIAGEPLYNSPYFNHLKEKAGKNVLFLGRVDGEKKQALLANALLYVQASQAEGLSISLLEAMSHACPVLVSDIPQNVEAVGETGFLFKSRDLSDLTLQLEKILAYPPDFLEKAGRKGQKRIETIYNWERLKPLVENFYSFAEKPHSSAQA